MGVVTLARWLVHSAMKLTNEGKLDEALEQYLAAIRIATQYRDWCQFREGISWDLYGADVIERDVYACLPVWETRPDQTPERILTAQRQLKELTSHSSLNGLIIARYLLLRRILNGDLLAISTIEGNEKRPLPMLAILWLRLPWERARALRLLNFQTYCELQGAWRPRSSNEIPMNSGACPRVCNARFALAELRNSELLYTICKQIGLPSIFYNRNEGRNWSYRFTPAESFKCTLASRRATQIILALEAWKLMHGSLPKTLDELVGPCVDRLPDDPYSGESFRYFPNGVAASLRWQPPWERHRLESHRNLPADTPFLWSTGTEVQIFHWLHEQKDVLDEYKIAEPPQPRERDPYSWRRPTSEFDVWSSGWPFPIP